MIKVEEFKEWLHKNTQYSSKVVNDVASRMKRADDILEWHNDETYLFYLEKEDNFRMLTMSVKSQLRKAVRLYSEFAASEKA